MITNKTRIATSSVGEAMAQIDEVLAECEHGIESLTSRNMTHLPSFEKLRERYQQLLQKQKQLVHMTDNHKDHDPTSRDS